MLRDMSRNLQFESVNDSLKLLHDTQVGVQTEVHSLLHHFFAALHDDHQDNELRFRAIENKLYDNSSLLQETIKKLAPQDELPPPGSAFSEPEELVPSASTIEEVRFQTITRCKAKCISGICN